MRNYCLLMMRSNTRDAISGLFPQKNKSLLEVEDLRSETNMNRNRFWNEHNSGDIFLIRNDLPRYCWKLNSLNGVNADNADPASHITWLLSRLKKNVSLSIFKKMGGECSLEYYWGGGGTGGGPTINPQLCALLHYHEINLNIGFYFEE